MQPTNQMEMYPTTEDIYMEIQRVDNDADMFHRVEVQNRDHLAEDRPTGQEEIIGCIDHFVLVLVIVNRINNAEG